ncbi:hypothetical protein BY996DRAFT_6611952 [Phakopsora pachyrhizi]|nr:hypothetical protein BY996DRAFT_6611952 [Phakopsora pachyrhizi]
METPKENNIFFKEDDEKDPCVSREEVSRTELKYEPSKKNIIANMDKVDDATLGAGLKDANNCSTEDAERKALISIQHNLAVKPAFMFD